jgi:hypothetical protein
MVDAEEHSDTEVPCVFFEPVETRKDVSEVPEERVVHAHHAVGKVI